MRNIAFYMNRALACAILFLVMAFAASLGGAQAADSSTYEIISDIPYPNDGTEYAQERCKLDLYLPKDQKDFPVLVWFHGGFLQGQGKWTRPQAAQRFAAEGFGVVLPNYRVYPRAAYPEFIEDAASVVAWTFQHIVEHGGNPDRLFVGGHSAGAYLAAMVAMDARYLEPHHLSAQQIAGVISLSGEMFGVSALWVKRGIYPKVIDDTTPIFYARRDVPPFLCLCSERQRSNECEESEQFIEALRAAGHDNVAFERIPGRDEASMEKMTDSDDPVVKLMLTFMQKIAEEKSMTAAELNQALGKAARDGDVQTAKALLAAGAEVDSRAFDGQQTPLMLAAYRGHDEVMKTLIEAGAYVNATEVNTTHSGSTALEHALSFFSGQPSAEGIRLLLDSGANMDPSPLFLAIQELRELGMAGKNDEGRKIMSMLIEAGADVNAREQNSDMTPLVYAACRKGGNQFIDILLQSGAEINAKVGASGITALVCAVEMQDAETVKMLIAAGADLEMADNSGKTPLMRAKSKQAEEIVQLLSDAGATR